MAPSAGLVSLLAGSVTPSFLLEAAGEYLKSLDTEINECELGINQGFNDDETKINEEREREGNFSSGGHDDRDETIKELEERARRQTGRKGNGGYRPKKGNGDELAWLRKDRDVIVQDIRWLQALHTSTASPSPLSSSQKTPSTSSSISTAIHNPPSVSSNFTPTHFSSPSFSSRSTAEPESHNSNSNISSSSTTITTTSTHQHVRCNSRDGLWSRRSKVRGRDRVRRLRRGGDEPTSMVGGQGAEG